jgi:drug/metabolite transporter (DMT)-like permease
MSAFSLSAIPIGIRFMLLSAFGFAVMSACVKYVSLHGIPLFEIVAARALVSLIISYTDVKRKGLSPFGNNKPLLLLRGVLGTAALMCVYYAVTTLPLAEATVLEYMHPRFSAVVGFIVLKERLQGATLVSIVLCLGGLYLMVQPNLNTSIDSALAPFSVAIALLGALGSSVAYVIVRKLSRSEDSSVIILYFPMVALPVSVVLMWSEFVMPSLPLTFLLVLVGVFTQIGQYGLTKAMQTQQAGEASAYAYVQIVFSTLIGIAIFQELPSMWTYLGGGLIVAGALFNAVGHRLFRRRLM